MTDAEFAHWWRSRTDDVKNKAAAADAGFIEIGRTVMWVTPLGQKAYDHQRMASAWIPPRQ